MIEERENSMAHWIQSSEGSNIKGGKKTFSQNLSKIERIRILEKLGLPLEKYLYIPPQKVKEDRSKILNFAKECGEILIIAIPSNQSLPRKFRKIKSEISEVENFLEEVSNINEYSLLVKKHTKPIYSGIIISNENRLVIEVSREELNDLLDGKGIPSSYTLENSTGKETWFKEEDAFRKVVDKAKELIKTDKEFTKGYFEFIVNPDGKITFWEYKNDPKYMKV